MDNDECPSRTTYNEPIRHVGRARTATKLAILAIAAAAVLLVVFAERQPNPRKEHDKYVSERPAWKGREWRETEAVLFEDPGHPLTYHVCTFRGCGHYFEDKTGTDMAPGNGQKE